MKLRNKKTGEHGEYQVVSAGYLIRVRNCDTNESYQYDCIAGLNDNWEDYKPTEPLIKDEKIRKVVRAWAKINTFETGYSVMYDAGIFGLTSSQADIEFNFPLEELKGGKYYTIEELCGEEEE